MVVWLIGLSGAGKTTLATEIVARVNSKSVNTVLLDGDVIREVFGNDLGYSIEDRLLNARRICQLGKLLDDQGINVVCAILSIFAESREWNRKNLKNYYEVYIDTPIDILEKRDSKGIYMRYKSEELSEVAGKDLDFPVPENPDLVIRNIHSKDKLVSFAKPIAQKILNS
jgi:adenylyl-sulfate kinase